MNFDQRGLEFEIVVVLQPRTEGIQYLRPAAPPYRHYERETELVLVRIVQRLEALIFNFRALIEPGAGLLLGRFGCEFAGDLSLARQVGVCTNQRQLFFGVRVINAISHELGKTVCFSDIHCEWRNAFGHPR